MASMAIRILLIDDDVRLFELLTSYLDQNGFAVTVASDGRKGLVALESGTFDAVLLDVMMPGMDGIEVCKRNLLALSRLDQADPSIGQNITLNQDLLEQLEWLMSL